MTLRPKLPAICGRGWKATKLPCRKITNSRCVVGLTVVLSRPGIATQRLFHVGLIHSVLWSSTSLACLMGISLLFDSLFLLSLSLSLSLCPTTFPPPFSFVSLLSWVDEFSLFLHFSQATSHCCCGCLPQVVTQRVRGWGGWIAMNVPARLDTLSYCISLVSWAQVVL